MARVWLSLGVLFVAATVFAAESSEGEAKTKPARSPAMVRVEFAYVEIPVDEKGEAAKPLQLDALPKSAKILVQGEVTSLEGQAARIQLSRREPRITGVATTGAGRSTNSVTFENVGTMVTMTPTVSDDGRVMLQIEFDDSRPGLAEEGTVIAKGPQGEEVRTWRTETDTLKTTVGASNGQTLLVGGMNCVGKASYRRAFFVTPHLIPVGGRDK